MLIASKDSDPEKPSHSPCLPYAPNERRQHQILPNLSTWRNSAVELDPCYCRPSHQENWLLTWDYIAYYRKMMAVTTAGNRALQSVLELRTWLKEGYLQPIICKHIKRTLPNPLKQCIQQAK